MIPVKGILAIFLDPSGKFITSAANFDTDHPGGFSVKEVQRTRAKAELALMVMRLHIPNFLVDSIDVNAALKILDGACRIHKYQISYVEIGYAEV